MKWLKQMLCKHLYTTKDPIEDPNTWSYIYECGKCGYKHDVTRQVVIGQIPLKSPEDKIDAMMARKRAINHAKV